MRISHLASVLWVIELELIVGDNSCVSLQDVIASQQVRDTNQHGSENAGHHSVERSRDGRRDEAHRDSGDGTKDACDDM